MRPPSVRPNPGPATMPAILPSSLFVWPCLHSSRWPRLPLSGRIPTAVSGCGSLQSAPRGTGTWTAWQSWPRRALSGMLRGVALASKSVLPAKVSPKVSNRPLPRSTGAARRPASRPLASTSPTPLSLPLRRPAAVRTADSSPRQACAAAGAQAVPPTHRQLLPGGTPGRGTACCQTSWRGRVSWPPWSPCRLLVCC